MGCGLGLKAWSGDGAKSATEKLPFCLNSGGEGEARMAHTCGVASFRAARSCGQDVKKSLGSFQTCPKNSLHVSFLGEVTDPHLNPRGGEGCCQKKVVYP